MEEAAGDICHCGAVTISTGVGNAWELAFKL